MKLGALLAILNALVDFILWATDSLKAAVVGVKKENVKKAVAQAKKAKTKDEKIAAAKKMESAFGLRSRGSKPSKPRRK